MKKWNKMLALLLAMVMAFGMTVTAFADGEEATEPVEDTTTTETTPADETTPAEDEDAAAGLGYTDVTEANWFYEAVAYVTEKGLVDGETETTFAPNTSMTRADLVTALYRLAGSPEVTAENPFTDVAADAEYYNAVMWAYTNGVVGGITDTTYEPDSFLQRQQVATMLYRYLNDEAAEEETTDEAAPAEDTTETTDEAAPAEDTTETTDEAAPVEDTTETADEETAETEDVLAQFVDADQVQAYAKEAMAWAVTVGLFGGDDKGALDPRGDITRAEVATIIMRFVEMSTVETPEDAIGGADAETGITVTEGENP